MWCWRRLLRVPWTARRWNKSILKETNTKYSLEGLLLKLKLQYLGYLMWRADSLRKILMQGKIEGKRRMGQQRKKWLDSITDLVDMNLSKLWEIMEDRGAWRVIIHGVAKSQTWLSDWTTTTTTATTIIDLRCTGKEALGWNTGVDCIWDTKTLWFWGNGIRKEHLELNSQAEEVWKDRQPLLLSRRCHNSAIKVDP